MNIARSLLFLHSISDLINSLSIFMRISFQDLIQDITINKDFGVDLGSNIYKKRVKNLSIPTGKSGGFKVLIYKKRMNLVTNNGNTRTFF